MEYITLPIKALKWPFAATATYAYNSAKNLINYVKPVPPNLIMNPLWKSAGPFVKIAALSGAAAVAIDAYGHHRKFKTDDLREVHQLASRYHYIHTLALLSLPFCRKPILTGVFFVSGIVLFSGTCYYYAFTCNETYKKFTPVGGVCLIIGWLSMCI